MRSSPRVCTLVLFITSAEFFNCWGLLTPSHFNKGIFYVTALSDTAHTVMFYSKNTREILNCSRSLANNALYDSIIYLAHNAGLATTTHVLLILQRSSIEPLLYETMISIKCKPSVQGMLAR